MNTTQTGGVRLWLIASFVFCWLGNGRASEEAGSERVDYISQIKPILERCYGCHGALRQRAGLRLDAAQLIREGGDSGPAIEPGQSRESLLIEAVTGEGFVERMPPDGDGELLEAEQIELLKAWIDQGALAQDEVVPPDPRFHWAYQRISRPEVPAVRDSAWARGPVDAFLGSVHESRDIRPSRPARPEALLRRVYLDLVGLPPSREQLNEFLRDPSDQAYEAIVDRLLANPRYGERWGRHWMDIWRYSDWFGLPNKIRHSHRHIWRWRDWIIESMNQDKGYDRMVVEMLAGDELDPTNSDTVRGTGFLARSWYLYNRNTWLADLVEHTGKAFLGITFNCVRCHEHKYDPITHEEYYRFRAFFEPHDIRIDLVGSETDPVKDGVPRAYDADLQAKTYLFVRGQEEQPDKSREYAPGVPAVLGSTDGTIESASLPVDSYFPSLRPEARNALIAAADVAVDSAAEEERKASSEQPLETRVVRARLAHLIASREALKARFAADQAKYLNTGPDDLDAASVENFARTAARAERHAAVLEAEFDVALAEKTLAKAKSPDGEQAGDAAATDEKKRRKAIADAETKLSATAKSLNEAKSALESAGSEYTHVGKVYPSSTTGRRLALARWMTRRDNPLAARVAVNHIWTRHFGAPLVGSMYDFGLRTKRPIHHDLLDWLAAEFMEGGWSMKSIHRQLVLSNAYRMHSGSDGASDPRLKTDPDNLLFWRMNPRRMEAELVRDTLIYLTGKLNSTMRGAEIPVVEADDGTRRTIYYRYARDDQIKLLTIFDAPNVDDCYRRRDSIVPQQALAMTNSKLVLTRAREVAARLVADLSGAKTDGVRGEADRDLPDETQVMTAAFELVLSRRPTPDELSVCHEALERYEALESAQALSPELRRKRARENLVHVLLNHNDFITIR